MPNRTETAVGIRIQAAADRRLQSELTMCLEDLASELGRSLRSRLARIVTVVLPECWLDHVDWRENVIGPILAKAHAHDSALLGRLKTHTIGCSDLVERHTELCEQLMTAACGSGIGAEALGYLLRSTFEFRRRHIAEEAELDLRLPTLFTPAQEAIYGRWLANRGTRPFPMNVMLPDHFRRQ